MSGCVTGVAIQTMTRYYVDHTDPELDDDGTVFTFVCSAKWPSEAIRQCRDRYPYCEVVEVYTTRGTVFGRGMNA